MMAFQGLTRKLRRKPSVKGHPGSYQLLGFPGHTSFNSPKHSRRRILAALVVVGLYILFYHFPAPPKTQNNTGSYRPAPNREVHARPHFLHHSAFREDPDIEYESRLEKALKGVEEHVLRDEGVPDGLSDKLWQIMLSAVDRDEDSISLQESSPEWNYTIATDGWATDFVTNTLSSVPDLADIYNSFPRIVLRADFLRYLILWYYGGYYADLDVFLPRPIYSCSALQPIFHRSGPNVSLILGVEIDEPYASPKLMEDWHWSRSYGFIQYTMYASCPFSPFLRRTIVRILAHTKQHRDASSWFFDPEYNEESILEITGPGVFTDAVLDVLSETLPLTHPLMTSSVQADVSIGDLLRPATEGTTSGVYSQRASDQLHPRVTWAPFYGLSAPLWVDASEAESDKDNAGLGVLPINVWGNGQRHSGAEDFRSVHACVNHRFGRTWKKGWWEYFFG